MMHLILINHHVNKIQNGYQDDVASNALRD